MQYLDKAKKLIPIMYTKKCEPLFPVKIENNKNTLHGIEVKQIGCISDIYNADYKNGDSFTLDFGTHLVGYLSLKIKPKIHAQDSPLRLRLLFAEMPCEITDEEYTGGLSSTWVQEEIINIDVLALPISLPRRYAFRYLKIEILGRNTAYKVQFEEIYCISITSADESNVKKLPSGVDRELAKIDETAIRTLKNCMTDVFEDGPKRDRRLWLGDLRLQAIANYYTFNNTDLVKRCLYLFAGLPHDNGLMSSCVFHEPTLMNDTWILHDYSLFFISTLYDYYTHTGDIAFVKELWNTAVRQAEVISGLINDKGLVTDFSCFTDWCNELDKCVSMQAVTIYSFKQAMHLADALNDTDRKNFFKEKISVLTDSAIKYMYDENTGLFVSGEQKQISWASQVWMVLAKVFPDTTNKEILKRLIDLNPDVRMRTPYMYHHFIQALIDCGLKDEALSCIKGYWGKMTELNADCFWEVFAPEDLYLSPYGSYRINSYCHAWSCTPTYFIRKYFT